MSNRRKPKNRPQSHFATKSRAYRAARDAAIGSIR